MRAMSVGTAFPLIGNPASSSQPIGDDAEAETEIVNADLRMLRNQIKTPEELNEFDRRLEDADFVDKVVSVFVIKLLFLAAFMIILFSYLFS